MLINKIYFMKKTSKLLKLIKNNINLKTRKNLNSETYWQISFKKQVEDFTKKENLSLNDYQEYLVDNLSKNKKRSFTKIFSEKEEKINDLVEELRIINILKEEFEDLKKFEFSNKKKKNISEKAEVTEKKILEIIQNFKNFLNFQKWLKEKKFENKLNFTNEESMKNIYLTEKNMRKEDLILEKGENNKLKTIQKKSDETKEYQKNLQNNIQHKNFPKLESSYIGKKIKKQIKINLEENFPIYIQNPEVLKNLNKSKIEIDLVFTSHPTMAFDLEGKARKNKPTIDEEFKEVYHYLRNAQKVIDKNVLSDIKINFSLWVGGDRDGNPFVTSEVSSKFLDRIDQKWKLDIREDSKEIHEFVRINLDPKWAQKNDSEKKKFLDEFDFSNLKNIKSEISDTVNIMIKDERYIISNCKSFIDIYIIYKLASYYKKDISIVPLFEKYEYLLNAESIMESSIKYGVYKKEEVEVMLAYSDNSKTGGVIDATFSLFLAQKKIFSTLKNLGKKAIFFHGRGGTFPRGGGTYKNFFLKLPNESISDKIRITVQGERIYHEFGSDDKTLLTINEINNAIKTRKNLFPNFDYSQKLLYNAKKVSELSQKRYRTIVSNQETINFFMNYTYQENLELLNCGCRPGKRKNQKKFYNINDLRMITWVFGWSSISFYLPWFLGYGKEFIDFTVQNSEFYPWKILVPDIHNAIKNSMVSNHLPKELMSEFIHLGSVLYDYDKIHHYEEPIEKLIFMIQSRGYVG